MSASPGNKNAIKGAGPATSHLHIRCEPRDKAGWVRAAGGRKLAAWVVENLNIAAGVEPPGAPGPAPPGESSGKTG